MNSLKAVGGRILPNNCLDLPQLLLGEPLEHAGGTLRAPVVGASFQRDLIPLFFAEVHLMVSGKLVAWQACVIWTVQDKHLWQQISVSFFIFRDKRLATWWDCKRGMVVKRKAARRQSNLFWYFPNPPNSVTSSSKVSFSVGLVSISRSPARSIACCAQLGPSRPVANWCLQWV